METCVSLCRAAAVSLRNLGGRRLSQREELIQAAPEHPGVDSGSHADASFHSQQSLRPLDVRMLHTWRHPNLRLAVAIFLAVINFVMFVEDPCSFAKTEAELSLVGTLLNLVFRTWPPELWLCFMKVILLVLGLPLGFLFGRFVLHHLLLRDTLKLPMFSEYNGTISAQVIGVAAFSQIVAWAWRQLLLFSSGEAYAQQYTPSSGLTITDATLAYWLQNLTAAGDVFTIVMLLDVMLQDTSQYSRWFLRLRILWTRSCIRLGTTYVVIPLLFLVQVVFILQSYSWDVYLLETERSRGFIAALIFMLDVMTVCQDWEFPFFDNPLEVNLVGTNAPDLDLGCAACHCSGKWLNYGPMVLVMLLDLNNLNNQWRYGFFDAPTYYGQYLDANGWIWAVTNRTIAENLRKCYSASPDSFHPAYSRGSCAHAVPCNLTAGDIISEEPPCFEGDRRLTGSVQQLDWADFLVPAIPVILSILIFIVTAFRIPQLPAEQQRREAALSLMRAQRAAEASSRGRTSSESQETRKPLTLGGQEGDGQARLLRIAPAVVEWSRGARNQVELPEFYLMESPRTGGS